MAAPRKVDWDRIEPDWRAGLKSPQQMAEEYEKATKVSVTREAINKHFKKLGIPRDLDAKVHNKAAAMVSAAMVTGKVTNVTSAKDADIIDGNAFIEANIRLSHRQAINKGRMLVGKLFAECEALTDNQELFDRLGEFLQSQDQTGLDKLNEIYNRVISLPSRIKGVKELTETLKNLIGLEREAYGIGPISEPPPPDNNESDGVHLEAARRVAFMLAKGALLEKKK